MEYIHQNYDAVFKESFVLFKDRALDFLGLTDIPPITESLITETVEIKIAIRDLVFGTQDGKGLNFESEVDLSNDDLLRFCNYNIGLRQVYNREFDTIVFVKNPTTLTGIHTKQLEFKPIIVQCSKFDADMMLDRLKKDIAANKPVNELELVYLPLFRSIKYSPTEIFKESTSLIKYLQVDSDRKQKIYALSIVLANKVVDKDQLDAALEEVLKMGNIILETVEEYGRKKGKEEEKVEIARKMLNLGIDMLDIIEATGLSAERLREIRDTTHSKAV